MRILICGGREFANQEKFDLAMSPFYDLHYETPEKIVVIHGACGWPTMKGADAMADRWALSLGLVVNKALIRRPADWKKYSNAAGHEEMLREEKPDWVIAFPGWKRDRQHG